MHPVTAQHLAQAHQADVDRRRAAAELRAQAVLHRRARPPSPGRVRVRLARTLAATARRLAPDEAQRQLRSA